MLKLTQETIAQQSTALFDELTDVVIAIRATPDLQRDQNWHMQPIALKIEEVILRHTNLKMSLRSTDTSYPSVLFYSPKSNHIFSNYNRGNGESVTQAYSKNEIALGTIDLINAKVGGVYAEFTSLLIYPKIIMFGSNLTPREVVATILHEVGHVFTSFEYANRIHTTNIFLSNVARKLDGSSTMAQTKDLYQFYKDNLGAKAEDVLALTKATTQEEANILVMGQAHSFCESELGSSVFDENGMEALADQFAARLGAGKELVTSINKLERSNRLYDQKYNGAISSAVTVLLMGVAVVNPVLTVLVTLTFGLNVFSANKNLTYGSTKLRFERLLQQNTDRLKERGLADDEKRAILEDNKTIAKILTNYNEGNSLILFMAYWLKKDYRKQHDQETMQRGLEKLANSRLFDLSARLSLS